MAPIVNKNFWSLVISTEQNIQISLNILADKSYYLVKKLVTPKKKIKNRNSKNDSKLTVINDHT